VQSQAQLPDVMPQTALPSDAAVQPEADVASRHSLRHSLFTFVRLAMGIGILLYLSRSGIINFHSLTRLLTAWPITIAAFAILLLDVTLMSVRLSLLFRPHDLSLPVRNAFQLTLVGFFFSMFLPGAAGGDLPKLYYATKGNNGRRTEVGTIVLLDRVIGLLSLLLPPLLVAPFFTGLIRSVHVLRDLVVMDGLLVATMLVGGVLCMYSDASRNFLSHTVLGWTRLKTTAGRILDTIATYRKSPRTILAALGLSFVANLSVIALTGLAILALNPSELRARMLLVVPMGHIVNSLPLTPGGIGVGETAFSALFHLAAIKGGAEALLCWRVWNAMIGLLGLLVYVGGIRRLVFNTRRVAEPEPIAADVPREAPELAEPEPEPALVCAPGD
jgi:glycosyltransferase 2 family protein